VASPYTLAWGEVAVGFHVLNFDRDPGDHDVIDYRLVAAVGLPKRMEFFLRYTPFLHVNSVNMDPVAFPPPPFDLVVDIYPTPALRPPPYFLYAQEIPFKTYSVPETPLDPPSFGAFSTSSGDLVLGIKRNLLSEGQGHWLGFGIQGYLELPTERPGFRTWSRQPFLPGAPAAPLPEWRKKVGTSGERDFGLDLLSSKTVGKWSLALNLGYKRVGDPEGGLRLHFVNSGASRPEDLVASPPIELQLDLKDELQIVAGVSRRTSLVLNHQVEVWGQFLHKRFVGSGTPVVKLVHPLETLFGAQFSPQRLPWLHYGIAALRTWNRATHGGQRFSVFEGDINFSELVNPQLAEEVKTYLTSRGVPLFQNANGVLSSDNPAFDGWRNIPTGPRPIVAKGHGAVIGFINIGLP
jgi:hypothetical protein